MTDSQRSFSIVLALIATLPWALPSAAAQEWKSGVEWQEPVVVTPGEVDEAVERVGASLPVLAGV